MKNIKLLPVIADATLLSLHCQCVDLGKRGSKCTKHISTQLVHLPGQNMEYADWKKLFVGSAESSCHGHQLWNQFCSDQICVVECTSDIEQMPVEPGTGCSEIILTVNTLSFSDNIQEKALLLLGTVVTSSVMSDVVTKTTVYFLI
jgi:hypothetical protein